MTKRSEVAPSLEQFSPDQTDAPADAFRCALPVRQLAWALEADDRGNVPVSIVARTAEPIDHWYWGRIVHDLSGFSAKPTIPIDYCHDYEDDIGFVNQFEADTDRLFLRGELCPFPDDPSDRAQRVISKARRGIPYEASIDWNGPAVIEYLDAGESVEVNGGTFTGPGVCVRKWSLVAVAICPHGADGNTETQFRRPNADRISFQLQRKPGMSNKPNSADSQPAAVDTLPASSFTREEADRYSSAFGLIGLEWLVSGKTFDQCRDLQFAQLTASIDAERAQFASDLAAKDLVIEGLQKQLAAAKRLADTDDVLPLGATPTGGRPRLGDLFGLDSARSAKRPAAKAG